MTAPIISQRILQEQTAFRALLDGTARPGTIHGVEPIEGHGPYGGAMALLLAVLDHEVSFAVFPESRAVVEALLRLTGSYVRTPEDADFVLTSIQALPTVLSRAKAGSPEYPDRGASLVVVVEAISPGASGTAVQLSGPGINGKAAVSISGVEEDLIARLAEQRALLPQGVDLVFVEPGGTFTCVPRYTRLTKGDN